jgi:ABC-type sugar transport system substrate-binding protein
MGETDAKWLVAHPPKNGSKEVGIVSLQPGEYAVLDREVSAFKKAVTAAGYQVVATGVSDNSLADTRTLVTNMLTAHPNLGAIFSSQSVLGGGVTEGLMNHPNVEQLTVDGVLTDIPKILNGTIGIEAAQDPIGQGSLPVQYMAMVLEGKRVPKVSLLPTEGVTKENAAAYRAVGGMP